MADNVAITAGAGTTVAADEVSDGTLGSVKVQYVKLMDGTLDGTNKLLINSNGSLPMQGYQPSATTFSAVSTTGALASTTATSYNVATVTLRTFTGTGPSVTFKLQASDDNTNWVDLQGINNTTGVVGSSFTQAAALTAGTAGPSIDYTVGAFTNVRINVTAISGTTPVAAFGLALQSMPYEASPGAVAQGTAAAGSAIAGNPVLIGGSDGTNARALKTNTTGQADIRPLTTADAVSATLAAETTKVIGVTRTADGSGNLLTSTSSALDVNLKTSAATNISTNVAQVNGVTTLAGNGVSGTGAQRVTIASDSTGQIAPAANATATGLSTSYQSAFTNTKVVVNASAGNLYGVKFYNPNNAATFVQLFNLATGSVTLGTTTPTDVFVVPAQAVVQEFFPIPVSYGTALTVAATTTAGGLTAPTSTLNATFYFK